MFLHFLVVLEYQLCLVSNSMFPHCDEEYNAETGCFGRGLISCARSVSIFVIEYTLYIISNRWEYDTFFVLHWIDDKSQQTFIYTPELGSSVNTRWT